MDGYGELERQSFALLNGHHRLRFAAVIAGLDTEFRTAEVNEASALEPSAVSKELKHFADAGMLRKIAHGRWRRLGDPFWQGGRELVAERDRELGPPQEPTVLRPVSDDSEG
jgi:hypothetical protein